MVSDEVDPKILGKRSQGNAIVGISNPILGKQSARQFYKLPDSDAVGVAHPPQKSITRHTNESTTRNSHAEGTTSPDCGMTRKLVKLLRVN